MLNASALALARDDETV